MNTRLSIADQLAQQAGTSIIEVARRWPTRRTRLKPREIQSRISYIRRAVRRGDLSRESAERLAHLLKCDARVFLWGAKAYQEGVAGTLAVPAANSVAAAGGDTRHHSRASRRVSGTPILTLVEDKP